MRIYPNESWPADSTVLEVDGTLDPATGLPFIAKGTGPTSNPSYEIQYNRRQMRQNGILAAVRQGMVVDEGGLKIGVYPIEYTLGGVRKTFDGATGVSVPSDAQRVVYLDASATLHVAAAWPADPHDYLPLAEINTTGGAVSIVDRRPYALYEVAPVVRRYVTGSCAQVSASQAALKVFECRLLEAMTLEQVQIFCTASTGTVSVDVRQGGSSVLAAPATPAAGNLVTPTVLTAAIGESSSLTVHVTTGASSSLSNLAVTLVLRS
ncbi:MAG TPA: hypothetical protein PL151_07735 [Phycisphaerae bacterium]|nr:hypothetical protein [Phycisphaerae bacterium]HOJ75289.1 hypothetical protein [Phycisphaerae bacterium]HOM53046.1 hypothetical protein [Phycisphaerae bacterium]HON66983.1 hypothetical protein [Phycisphaerae bacterium]HOQ87375.1 hypothetical protein [Phycisphaerae bacterium]